MTSTKIIRLSKSSIGEDEKLSVMHVLDHEYLGMGADVDKFESELGIFFSRPVVCVANGTAALHLALQACGIGHGDEVLVQSLTYVASFQAISATGATPIACDINPSTLTLDWRDAERRITSNTKAVMPVHYSGGVGELDEIYEFARKYGLRVVEDAAHAFGSVYKDKLVGGVGDIACFSFDGIKNITSGEGGCIVTDDPLILQRVKDARLLGVEKDTEMRYAAKRSWEFEVSNQGWRYHMSNIMAAIGSAQLRRAENFFQIRRAIARLYDEHLRGHPLISLIQHDYNSVVPHIYTIRIQGLRNREKVIERLESSGIQYGRHYQPNHLLAYYSNSKNIDYFYTDSVYAELLTLPLHTDLTLSDVRYICKIVKSAFE